MNNKKANKKYFIGVDLHSNQLTCCFLASDNTRTYAKFSVDDKGIQNFIKMAGQDADVSVEASTGTFEFVYRIRDHVNSVYVVNPHKMKLISMVKKKTDRVDAEKLAMYLKMQLLSGEKLIKPVHVPGRTIKELRSLFVSYKTLTKIVVQLKNSIHSIYKQNLINVSKSKLKSKIQREVYLEQFTLPESFHLQVKILLDQLEATENNLKKIEDQIQLQGAPYYNEIDILTSMKGISVIMAIALIADISTITRFQNSKHLTSYLRSAPSVDSSNEKTIIGKTNKFGRKLSISLLTQSIQHFKNANPYLNEWYSSKGEVKGKGKMRMAVTRKIISQIYHMLSKNEYHRHRDEINHAKKMKRYNNFLKKHSVEVEDVA